MLHMMILTFYGIYICELLLETGLHQIMLIGFMYNVIQIIQSLNTIDLLDKRDMEKG